MSYEFEQQILHHTNVKSLVITNCASLIFNIYSYKLICMFKIYIYH